MQALTERIVLLREKDLTGRMVVKEFLRQRVAPLQLHSRALWTLEGVEDPLWLHASLLDEATLSYSTKVLFGAGDIPNPSGVIRPLYMRSQKMRDAILSVMPEFTPLGLPVEGGN